MTKRRQDSGRSRGQIADLQVNKKQQTFRPFTLDESQQCFVAAWLLAQWIVALWFRCSVVVCSVLRCTVLCYNVLCCTVVRCTLTHRQRPRERQRRKRATQSAAVVAAIVPSYTIVPHVISLRWCEAHMSATARRHWTHATASAANVMLSPCKSRR